MIKPNNTFQYSPSGVRGSNSPLGVGGSSFAIGIDIGGTNTVFGIVDHRGDIQYRGAISTKKHLQINDYIDELHNAVMPAIEQVGGINYIKGIGIGAPNGNYYKGTIEYAPNLNWKGIVPLTDLILGHDGFAGELGHTIIIPDGRQHWGTNAKGSLEAYCSATGVKLTALEMLDKSREDSLLRNYAKEEIDSRIVYDCAVQGDKIANDVYAFTGYILGKSLANFIMFSSPEAVILFGGLCKAGDLILTPTKKAMEAHLLPIFQNKVKLLFSELKEADAAVLGASALVWEMKN